MPRAQLEEVVRSPMVSFLLESGVPVAGDVPRKDTKLAPFVTGCARAPA